MAFMIGGGLGDADDTDTSADSVASGRPVGDMDGADQTPLLDMDALSCGIRFFKSGPPEKNSKKVQCL